MPTQTYVIVAYVIRMHYTRTLHTFYLVLSMICHQYCFNRLCSTYIYANILVEYALQATVSGIIYLFTPPGVS